MIAEWFSSSWAGFGAELGNHLWQSTVFVAVAALLALALRKNHARARYWLWLAASLKFLVPFSLLIALGTALAPARIASQRSPLAYTAMEKVTQPFALPTVAPMVQPLATTPTAATFGHALLHSLPAILSVIWLCGFVVVLATWCNRWRQVQAAKREAAPLLEGREVEILRRLESECGLRRAIPVFLSQQSLEPGIFGIVRPVLLWPAGISARLDDAQLEAILAHELSHVRRRDNLAAAIHSLVEAIFWFYPIVWWIGSRLIAERELACDEDVVQRGKAQQAYAEGILKVCQFCLEAPAWCVSGMTGADLKKRIGRIMRHSLGEKLTLGRRLLLGVAALAAMGAPIVFGLSAAQQNIAAPNTRELQTQQAAAQFGPSIKYDVTSIRVNRGSSRWGGRFLLDGFTFRDMSLRDLFNYAYGNIPPYLMFGEPDWWDSEKYDVLAKTDGAVTEKLQKMTPAQRRLAREWMIQELLADRFKMKVHWETRQLPLYLMTVAKGGLKIKEAPAGEDYGYFGTIDGKVSRAGSIVSATPGKAQFNGVNMSRLASYLGDPLGRPVADETGNTGTYDFVLRWAPTFEEIESMEGTGAARAAMAPAASNGQPAFGASDPNGYGPVSPKSIEKQLGLQLDPGIGPARVLVIDHVEKPSEN